MTRVKDKPSGREAQRLQTRQRLLGAAIAEFKRSGMATADVGAIVAAAGVAHGTFYFHFPTKEHVLLELEHREEVRMANELARFLDKPHDLSSVLREVVRLVVAVGTATRQLAFQRCSGASFLPDATSQRRVDSITRSSSCWFRRSSERATRAKPIPEVDAFTSGVFFLLGLYAVLTTHRHAIADRDDDA